MADKKPRKRKLKYQPNPLSCGAQHVAVVRNGDLYTWGRASHGRLVKIVCLTLYVTNMILT